MLKIGYLWIVLQEKLLVLGCQLQTEIWAWPLFRSSVMTQPLFFCFKSNCSMLFIHTGYILLIICDRLNFLCNYTFIRCVICSAPTIRQGYGID